MPVEQLRSGGVDAATAVHWTRTYGVRAIDLAERSEGLAARSLEPELPYRLIEVDEAVQRGMARRLVDVLGRRVPLLTRSRDRGQSAAPAVAQRMARLLGWDEARVQVELARYQVEVDAAGGFRS